MADINETIKKLFDGMDTFISTKSVVGEPVNCEDGTVIIPLVDVSFGAAAGAFVDAPKNKAAGGIGGRITPNSVLVIKDGKTRLVAVKNSDAVSRVLDLIPEALEKIKKTPKDKAEEEKMDKAGEDYILENEDVGEQA